MSERASEGAALRREHEIAGGKYTLRIAAVAVPLHGVFGQFVGREGRLRNESNAENIAVLMTFPHSLTRFIANQQIVQGLRAPLLSASFLHPPLPQLSHPVQAEAEEERGNRCARRSSRSPSSRPPPLLSSSSPLASPRARNDFSSFLLFCFSFLLDV